MYSLLLYVKDQRLRQTNRLFRIYFSFFFNSKKSNRQSLDNPEMLSGREIDGHKRQPDNTRGIHGKSDIFGLVEVFRYFARTVGIVCTGD